MTDTRPDEFRVALQCRQRAAGVRIRQGIFLIALVPVALVLSTLLASFPGELALVAALMVGGAATVIGPIAGLSLIAGGAVEYRGVARRLRQLEAPYLLPAARVVVRDHARRVSA